MRLSIAATTLLLAAAVTLLGVHPSSSERLRADVSAGHVSTVEAFGYRVPDVDGASAYATEEIHWRSGLIARSARVGDSDPDGPATDATIELRQLDQGLEVQRRPLITSTWLIYEIAVPGWTLPLAAAAWLSALITLVRGTEPWRLTRWGWAWSFLLVPPLGVLLFCLLSGPTSLIPRPRRARRIGGLGGFLLALVLALIIPGR